MKELNKIVKIAMTSLLAVTSATALVKTTMAASSENIEKCYGIVKAAMNDCQTSTASCAGSATKNRQPDAFIFLPKGTCNKIDGGSLTPIKSDQKK